MIEVNQVINGEFKPATQFEVLQASVLMEDMQQEVNKGKANVFGWELEIARIIFGRMKEQAKGWNDPNVTWQAAAATQFYSDAQAAITAGELQYDKKQLDGFKNAVRTIHTAMKNGMDLLERDDKTGNYKLSGKTQIEQANKKFKQKQEQAEHEAGVAALKAAGFAPKIAGENKTKAETSGTEDLLAGIDDEDVRTLIVGYIEGIKKAMDKNGKEGVVTSLEKGIRAMENHVKYSLNKEMKALRSAAAA